MKQNITLSLETSLLREAKILAAKRNTSVSRLLASELEGSIQRHQAHERAKRAALSMMKDGLPLGGIPASRDAWHER